MASPAATGLAEAAAKAMEVHGIGAGAPPAKPELWQEFRDHAAAERTSLKIQSRFYAGYSAAELNWSRPVHGIVVDFKGDSMQLGMILERLTKCGEQYVFIGNPLPFNGGWHFTAVNDFELPSEQRRLNPTWRDTRVWHRVNYVPSVTEDGAVALTPREAFNPANKHEGCIPVDGSCRLTTLIFTGGLMPHTINATAISEGSPLSLLIWRQFELGATLATVGHGLDVLLALGTPERSFAAGLEVAVFPGQDHLLEISGVRRGPESVCCMRDVNPMGACVVTAGFWGAATAEAWFKAVALEPPSEDQAADASRVHSMVVEEPVLRLDAARLPGMAGAVCVLDGRPPRVAVFVDEVADPIEIYTILVQLLEERLSFHLVSGSVGVDSEVGETKQVTSETVFGNAMYGLRECTFVTPTTPADRLPADAAFDSVFVAGGQCPYHMMADAHVTRVMDAATVAAAVCHGPEALIGSKWLRADGPGGNFTSYYGCWMSFRDVLGRFERLKPGEVCGDEGSSLLFSGNAPNATKEMARRACAAIKRERAHAGEGASAAAA